MCIFTCFVAQISPLHVCPVGPVSLFLPSCRTPHEYFSRHPAHTSSHTPERQTKGMNKVNDSRLYLFLIGHILNFAKFVSSAIYIVDILVKSTSSNF